MNKSRTSTTKKSVKSKNVSKNSEKFIIKNLDKLLSIETGMPVYVAEEPLDCVVRGAGKTLEDLERLKTVLVNSRKRK